MTSLALVLLVVSAIAGGVGYLIAWAANLRGAVGLSLAGTLLLLTSVVVFIREYRCIRRRLAVRCR